MMHVRGYAEYRGGGGGVQYRGGKIFCYLSTPTVLMISPTCIMPISPTVLKLQRMVSPTVLKISPMVLNTPTVLHTHHGTAHTFTGWVHSPPGLPFFLANSHFSTVHPSSWHYLWHFKRRTREQPELKRPRAVCKRVKVFWCAMCG